MTLALAIMLTACGGSNDSAPAASNVDVASTQASRPDDVDLNLPEIDVTAQDDAPATAHIAATSVIQAPATAYKAMWSWRDSDIITATARQNLINFALTNKVTSIYVSAEWLMRSYPAQLAAFIDLAASKNISVELLLANHEWALSANHTQALNQVAKANTFVRSLTGAKPVALHFDVEPHSLPNWATNQVVYGNQLVDLYTKIAAAKDPSLALNADIAMSYRWVKLPRNGVTKTMTQWVIDKTNSTTIMAYRDYALGADSITEHANVPITYAARRGKVTYVGVETNCGLEPKKITFCEEKRVGLNTELAKVINMFAGNPGFGGLAVHDFAGYSVLP
jgi:hypothetical protein